MKPRRAVLRADLIVEGAPWPPELLGVRVAGLSLIERHVRGFAEAGITEVEIWHFPDVPIPPEVLRSASIPGMVCRTRSSSGSEIANGLEQRADTLVDPRLIARAVEEVEREGKGLLFVDVERGNYRAADKSPYRVGAADDRDVRPASAPLEPFGLGFRSSAGESERVRLEAGRHYWHRFASPEDAVEATKKVFLSTMKPTDGIYARTNRRVSIPLSVRLSETGLTPNMVSVVTLLCSALAGALFATGTYAYALAGSAVSWVACMLDGVDGELARAKFQATEFGAWLEMVGDYLYYVFVFMGMSLGLYRRSQNRVWLAVGAGCIFAVVVSFALVALLKRKFKRHSGRVGFYLSFQRKLASRASNPAYGFLRQVNFIVTRAAIPYYFLLFAVFDVLDVLLVMVVVGGQIGWGLGAYALLLPPGPAGPSSSETTPTPPGAPRERDFLAEALSRPAEEP